MQFGRAAAATAAAVKLKLTFLSTPGRKNGDCSGLGSEVEAVARLGRTRKKENKNVKKCSFV